MNEWMNEWSINEVNNLQEVSNSFLSSDFAFLEIISLTLYNRNVHGNNHLFTVRKDNKDFYKMNINETLGELSRENMISSHVKITCFILFSEGTITNPAFWLVVSAGKILLYLPRGHGNAFVRFCPCVYKNWNSFLYAKKKKLFSGLGSVRIVKNCDLGLENAALGLRPRAAFSRPRSQFFTIRTSQAANNIYIFTREKITVLRLHNKSCLSQRKVKWFGIWMVFI